MVSTGIRRDVQEPTRHFHRLTLRHYYTEAPYRDMSAEELAAARRYSNPLSLAWQLWRGRPRALSGVEPFFLRQMPYAWTIALYARLLRVPLVVASLENVPLERKFSPRIARMLPFLLAPYLRTAGLVIAVNAGAEANLRAAGAPAARTIRALYGTWGVDTDEFSPEGPSETLPGTGPWLLFVGRVDAAKGVLDLVEAFSQLPAVLRGTLVIAGDGPDRAAAETFAEGLGCGGSVRFLGAVQNARVPALLRGATLVASPSRPTRKWEEQVGMVNLQALACGVPVVSSTSGSIPEFLDDGQTALLVPPGDVAALADALRRVLEDADLRRSLVAAGRGAALERFDARRNIERIEAEVVRLLEGAR
jgi:glycosyltransferase involved in cell wall biosynthesis